MTYRFDGVEIDAGGFRVTRAGASIRLEPKAVELLLFLAANAGRLVTKAEIQDAVWKDTFVTDNALTRLVAQIRKALGDDAREARYIETVPTRGYRFVARLESGGEGTRNGRGRGGTAWPSHVGGGAFLPAAVVATLLALTFVGLGLSRPVGPGPRSSSVRLRERGSEGSRGSSARAPGSTSSPASRRTARRSRSRRCGTARWRSW